MYEEKDNTQLFETIKSTGARDAIANLVCMFERSCLLLYLRAIELLIDLSQHLLICWLFIFSDFSIGQEFDYRVMTFRNVL